MELSGVHTTAGAAMEGPTPSEQVTARTMGGFDFSSSLRNKVLLRAGQKPPKALKTGTTICGVVFDGGVVLGADTRATEGTVVADKNCEKIHYLAPNIHCCGAGTAADTENITQLTASNLELLRRQMGTQSRVVTAMTLLKRRLFQYQGHISAALVLGGVDCTGPHLYTVYPHGSTDKLPFVSMGSGSLAAMAMLESGYKDGLTEDEAKALVARAIRAGIFNDLGSGSNVDLTIIRTDGATEQLRSYESQNGVDAVRAKALRPKSRKVPLGATEVLKETFKRFIDVSDLTVPGSATGGQAAS